MQAGTGHRVAWPPGPLAEPQARGEGERRAGWEGASGSRGAPALCPKPWWTEEPEGVHQRRGLPTAVFRGEDPDRRAWGDLNLGKVWAKPSVSGSPYEPTGTDTELGAGVAATSALRRFTPVRAPRPVPAPSPAAAQATLACSSGLS